MKKILIGLTFLVATNVFADVSGEYIKKNGVVELKQQGKTVEFSINSSVGQNVCNLEGTAVMINANRADYTPEDKSDKCVAVLNFSGSGLKVTTKGCDEYCGLNAGGSMDGSYQKKITRNTNNSVSLTAGASSPLLAIKAVPQTTPDKGIKSRSPVEVTGKIEFGHDAAGGNFWVNGGKKKQYTLGYVGEIDDATQAALGKIADAGMTVTVKGTLKVWKDGSASFDNADPISIFK